MSDILIKNIKMPDCCFRCPFKNYYGMWVRCIFTRQNVEPEIKRKTKASSCPLIEVSTPHGDLIDRDKASERFAELSENIEAKLGYECSASYTLASLFLQNKEEFPTIIEKEEKK